MDKFLVLAVGADRLATAILGEERSAEKAEVLGACQAPEKYVVMARVALANRSGPELVKLHNALLSPGTVGVTRFTDKETAVRRVLAVWDAQKVPTEAGGFVAPNAKPQASKTRKPLVRAGRNGLHINLLARPGKRWQKNSARYRAYEWIQVHPDLPLEATITQLGAHLGLNRAQVRGLLDKLKGVELLNMEAS